MDWSTYKVTMCHANEITSITSSTHVRAPETHQIDQCFRVGFVSRRLDEKRFISGMRTRDNLTVDTSLETR
jgi:hypothetical protein